MIRIIVSALLLSLVIQVGTKRTASACNCLPRDLASTYNHSVEVVKAWVWGNPIKMGSKLYYWASVRKTFKGCTKPGQWVLLVTSTSSAACGVELTKGTHLITASQVSEKPIKGLSINLCDYNVHWSAVTDAQKKWLNSRYFCCDEDCGCVNDDLVNCFINPCSPQIAPDCPEGECHSNYCGGCNAEFYNNLGQQVCTPCVADADCSFGLQCVDGQCLSPNTSCKDLAAVDFGMCEMVLGWGVVNGRCTLLSGCSSQGYDLLATEKECVEACIKN